MIPSLLDKTMKLSYGLHPPLLGYFIGLLTTVTNQPLHASNLVMTEEARLILLFSQNKDSCPLIAVSAVINGFLFLGQRWFPLRNSCLHCGFALHSLLISTTAQIQKWLTEGNYNLCLALLNQMRHFTPSASPYLWGHSQWCHAKMRLCGPHRPVGLPVAACVINDQRQDISLTYRLPWGSNTCRDTSGDGARGAPTCLCLLLIQCYAKVLEMLAV